MTGLVPGAILFGTESPLGSLRTGLVTTEERFAMSVEVFSQVAGPREEGFGGAAGVGAPPGVRFGV